MDPTLQAILDTGEQDGYTPVEMADAVKSWRNGTAKDIFGAADDHQTRITATRQLDAEASAALKTLQGTELRRHYDEAFGDAEAEKTAFYGAFEKAGYDPGKLQIEGQPAKNWLGIAQGIRGVTDSDIFDLPESGWNSTRGGSLMHGDVPVATYDTLHDGEKPRAVVRFEGEADSPVAIDEMIAAKRQQFDAVPSDQINQRIAIRKEIMGLQERRKKAGVEPLTLELPDFTKDDVQKRIEANKQAVTKGQKELEDLGSIDLGRDPEGGPGEQYGVERQKKKVEQAIQDKLAENQRLSKEGIRFLQAETIRQEILKPENRSRIPDQGLVGDILRGGAGLAINTGTAALVGLAGLGDEDAAAMLPDQLAAAKELQTVMPGAVPRHMEGGLANDILTGAAESLPTTAAILATGGASAALTSGTGALAPLVPMYASSYGAKYGQQMQQADALEEAGRLDEAEEMRRLANVAAHFSAGIATASERIYPGHAPYRAGATGGLMRAAGTVIQEGPIEEGIGQIAQNVVEPMTSGGVNQPDAFKGVATAVGAGAISALPFGAAVAFRGDQGRAQQAITEYNEAQKADPQNPKLDELRQRAEEAHSFLSETVQQAALDNPAANALVQTAEKIAGAPDVSLTVAALEQASGEVALQAALAEAERQKFGRPETPDATETAPTTEVPSQAQIQEPAPVTTAEVPLTQPAPGPVSEGATDADFEEAERSITSAVAPSATVPDQLPPVATEAIPVSQEVSGIPQAAPTVEVAPVQTQASPTVSPIAEAWDTMPRIDRQAIADEAGVPHVVDGWTWEQMTDETRDALTATDARNLEEVPASTPVSASPPTVKIRDFDANGYLSQEIEVPQEEAVKQKTIHKNIFEMLKRCLEGKAMRPV